MKKLLLFAVISAFVLVTSAGSKQLITEKAYQITIPQGWMRTSDLPYGIDVGFSKTLKEGETATFFFHYEIMPPEAGEPPTDTSDMQSQWDAMIRNNYPDARTVNRELPKVEGRILINGTYELTDNGAKVRRRYTYFLSGRTAFVVQCSASPSEWANALGEFDEIISTLTPSGSAPVQEKISDDSAVAKLKSDLPTLIASFPSGWACSLHDVSISKASADANRTLEVKIAFARSDIQDIYKAAKLIFTTIAEGKADNDLNFVPAELRGAASNSGDFIKYVGQVWGFASGFITNCQPPIEQYRVAIFDSNGMKIGTVSISMEDGIAILSGKVTADEARRIAGMYKFDVQDIVKVEVKNGPNGPKSKGKPVDTTYAHFSKWSLSFDYPKEWQEHPAERVAMMKDYLAKELRPYGRELQEFTMIVGPNNEIALLVTKYTTPTPMKPSEFVVERNQVYNDAMKAGDVTKVNHVKEATLGNLPAVDEDVERSNGGRGRSFKLIDGTIVFEISFVVNNAKRFSEYYSVLDHFVSTVRVTGKGKPEDIEGKLK